MFSDVTQQKNASIEPEVKCWTRWVIPWIDCHRYAPFTTVSSKYGFEGVSRWMVTWI